MINEVLKEYGFSGNGYHVEKYGSGLINKTWVIEKEDEKYILQQVNTSVFKKPEHIADNLQLIDDYLKQKHCGYLFIAPQKTISGKGMVTMGDAYYRIYPFVKNSRSFDVVATRDQAYEAARQFGRFTRLLSGIDISKIKVTLPAFHDLSLRFSQYREALQKGNPQRIRQSSELIENLNQYTYIAEEYEAIKSNPEFKLRVTHHDTKISNVLFDDDNKGICVIDLDTVMAGYFISDVGDMMRTYLSPVSEEEKDYSKIEIRDGFYKAIVKGYREEMEPELTETEKGYFFYSGMFMIYMQALRFLTDHLNNDLYYGAAYENHNLVRAGNQTRLLQKLIAKKDVLEPYAAD